ncbi:hypothetical protein [Noviherbaspirillum galbum]|uniref:TniQ family protein n=1 Tax=Noviherbaspirillum galbum TaxID=2709383 RepID=A0A6B3SYU3_9BURK|nr:hypothetical protein [Noviherbaspirillum galbum]NEX63339.1 hypothetical protein [Noviherbaspirillum galbum]
MKAARILIDEPLHLAKGWSWRDDWAHGYDSIYGLLSKFAMLNALGAKDLATLFIRKDCGRKTVIVSAPAVDLRDSTLFDIENITQLMRLDTQHVQHAFLPHHLANGRRRFREMLCWCPQCAYAGFHSPAFQSDMVRACPVHNNPIRSCCPACGGVIPYQLKVAVFARPFCCPACQTDLAPALRDPKERGLISLPPPATWTLNLTSLCKYEDRTLPTWLDLNVRRGRKGLGKVIFASGNWLRPVDEYKVFLDSVWHALGEKRWKAQAGNVQLPLVVEINSRPPPAVELTPGLGKVRASEPAHTRKPVSEVKKTWDDRLLASYSIYGTVRRHLWRHLLRAHRSCMVTAARQLDWRLEGTRTIAICPVAEAFLRWRMHWEGIGTPSVLFGPVPIAPTGLSGWVSAQAPICPAKWTREAEQWVSDHMLGRSSLASFLELLEMATTNARTGQITWQSTTASARHVPYWAITGRDTPSEAVKLFCEAGNMPTLRELTASLSDTKDHRQAHAAALRQICDAKKATGAAPLVNKFHGSSSLMRPPIMKYARPSSIDNLR